MANQDYMYSKEMVREKRKWAFPCFGSISIFPAYTKRQVFSKFLSNFISTSEICMSDAVLFKNR